MKNKKGSLLDNFMIMVEIFAFALFVLIMLKVWSEFTSTDLNAKLWDKTEAGSNTKNSMQRVMNNLDWISVFAYFGMHIGVIVLAFMLRSHPVVYIAGIFLIVIMVMIAAPLSNAWESVSQDSDFSSQITSISSLNYIMNNLPIFEMIWAFITLIAFAAFARGEGFI